ncbi:MAG: phosphatidylglycerophosphatase A [Candidatus Kaiserbacteria bacterium]|nr:phosphatidylglycerophosphatase A [Candidatus Kaiserbacteria bacterium]
MEYVKFIFATWFGSGFLPPVLGLKQMGGTWGSLAALPLCLALLWIGSPYVYAVIVLIVYAIGIYSIPQAELMISAIGPYMNGGKWKNRDQNQIVIDEVLGMLIAFGPVIGEPVDWRIILIGLLAFRLFDITKPPGVRYFDNLKNPNGVMLDDYVAGCYAACIVSLARFIGTDLDLAAR